MKFVFITGSGRCGTTLVRSLLDGHSQIDVYPIEVSSYLENFMKSSGFSNYLYFNKSHDDTIFDTLCFELICINSGKRFAIDRKDLKSHFMNLDISKLSPPMLLEHAVSEVFKDTEKLKMIDVTSFNVSGYLDTFENCKIIHLLRHPFDTLNSFFRERYKDPNSFGGSRPGQWTFGEGFEATRMSFQQAYIHHENERVHILKLEDLQNRPNETINEIFQFLELTPEKISYEQTQMGERFQNNSTYRKSTGIFKQPKDWSCLTPNDLFVLSKMPFADIWYDISTRYNAPNTFWPFLKRLLGFSGNNRPKLKSMGFLVTRLLPCVVGLYLQDIIAKSLFESKIAEDNVSDMCHSQGKDKRDVN